MATVKGEDAFTQLTKLNILDTLLIKGEPITGGSAIVNLTANYLTQAEDDTLICDGTFTVTLLPIADAIKQIIIKAVSGSQITLATSGSDTLEAGSSPVTSCTSVSLVPTSGNEWVII